MSTRTPTRPQPTFSPPPVRPAPDDDKPRFFGLSLSHLIATGFAAGTATVAGSFLGVSGTVIGAALASVLTAVGNAVYGTSIRRTRDRVRAVVPAPTRRPGAGARRAVRHSGSPVPTRMPTPPVRRTHRPRPGPAASGRRPTPWRIIALGSVGVFVAVLAGLTIVEVVAGRPLTDLVRGDSGSGTSLFGNGATHRRSPATPAPTVTQTVTPKVVVTTPTVTQPAHARTVTVTPTRTVTGSTGAPASSGEPSGSATPTQSPSQGDVTTQLP